MSRMDLALGNKLTCESTPRPDSNLQRNFHFSFSVSWVSKLLLILSHQRSIRCMPTLGFWLFHTSTAVALLSRIILWNCVKFARKESSPTSRVCPFWSDLTLLHYCSNVPHAHRRWAGKMGDFGWLSSLSFYLLWVAIYPSIFQIRRSIQCLDRSQEKRKAEKM